jgi:hypothetical protein
MVRRRLLNVSIVPLLNEQQVQCSVCLKLVRSVYIDHDQKNAYVCPHCLMYLESRQDGR